MYWWCWQEAIQHLPSFVSTVHWTEIRGSRVLMIQYFIIDYTMTEYSSTSTIYTSETAVSVFYVIVKLSSAHFHQYIEVNIDHDIIY